MGESRREGEKPCGRMAQQRQRCDPITRADSAERNRTPRKESPVTTIWFWNRSVLGLIDSGYDAMTTLEMAIPSMMDGPEGVRRGAKAPTECFFGTVMGD